MTDLEQLYRRAKYAEAAHQPVYLKGEEWPKLWFAFQTAAHPGQLPEPCPLAPADDATLFGQPVQISDALADEQIHKLDELWIP
jgi:hypothetical protein